MPPRRAPSRTCAFGRVVNVTVFSTDIRLVACIGPAQLSSFLPCFDGMRSSPVCSWTFEKPPAWGGVVPILVPFGKGSGVLLILYILDIRPVLRAISRGRSSQLLITPLPPYRPLLKEFVYNPIGHSNHIPRRLVYHRPVLIELCQDSHWRFYHQICICDNQGYIRPS